MSPHSKRQILLEFIQKYRELECLWKVSDINYRNKPKRFIAMKQLLEILKRLDPDSNIDSVRTKINSMRCAFHKAHIKAKESNQSADDMEENYVPKLWYYDLLLFLIDKDTIGKETSGNTAITMKTEAEEYVYTHSSSNSDISHYSERSITQNELQEFGSNPKIIDHSYTEPNFSTSTTQVTKARSKQKYNAFGEHIAEKLRNMPEDMAVFCQKLINDAIFYADCGKLNYSSHIVTK